MADQLTLPEMRSRLEDLLSDLHQLESIPPLQRIGNASVHIGTGERWILDLASEALAQREGEAQRLNGAWRCSCCGELMKAGDSRWRWNGQAWDHSHGQAGHFQARDFSPVTDGEAG